MDFLFYSTIVQFVYRVDNLSSVKQLDIKKIQNFVKEKLIPKDKYLDEKKYTIYKKFRAGIFFDKK